MFSNTIICPSIDFSEHPVFIRQEEEDLENPPFAPLQRQTNEWIFYSGVYPSHCAKISSEDQISRKISAGDRHVVGIKIEHDQERLTKRDIMRKMGDLVSQLEKFSGEGLTWRKSPGRVMVQLDDEFIIFKAYVCSETSMFHIIATGNAMTSEKTNKLLYSIRIMYQDNDVLPSFESIELTREKWESTYQVTREQTTAHVSFPLVVENIGVNPDTEEPATKKRRIE